MTESLYQTDSYLTEFEASIVGSDDAQRALELDRTAFYPGGGGQLPDYGMLRSQGMTYKVTRAKYMKGKIVHLIERTAPLPAIGNLVHAEINWNNRYKLMRTHTAMHILCGVIFRDYGASVTGGDMEPLKGRMDFEFETMHKELVEQIEQSINIEVANRLPIRTQILPREEAFKIPDLIRTKINLLPEAIQEVRTVEIEGLDLQADGGTHVRNTAEVGYIRVVNYKSKGKINKRIYVELPE